MYYRRRDSLARQYDISKRFVDTLVKEMEEEDRYPEDAVLRGKGYVLVEEDAFRDYLKNRAVIGIKMIPPYVRKKETPEDLYVIGERR